MLGVCAHPWQRSERRSLPQAGLWWKCRRVVSAADVTETPRVPAVGGGGGGVKVRGGGRWEGVGRKSKLNIAPEQRASCAGRSATQYSNFLLLMDLHTQSDPYRPPPPLTPSPPPHTHTPTPSSPLPFLPVLPRTASLISLPLASHRRVSFLASASESVTGCVPCCMKCLAGLDVQVDGWDGFPVPLLSYSV